MWEKERWGNKKVVLDARPFFPTEGQRKLCGEETKKKLFFRAGGFFGAFLHLLKIILVDLAHLHSSLGHPSFVRFRYNLTSEGIERSLAAQPKKML